MPSLSEEQASPIAQDVECIRCRYNLRGLSPGGRCPECGEKIASSLQQEDPVDQRRRWARTLRLGILLLLCSSAVSTILMFLTMFFRFVRNQEPGVGTMMMMSFVGPKVYCMPWFLLMVGKSTLMLMLVVASVLLNITAILLITVAGERPRDEGRLTLRGILRLAAGASIGASLSFALQGDVSDEVTLALVVFLEAVSTALLYWYLMAVAGRLPNHRIAWNLRALWWCILSLFVIMFLWLVADLRLTRGERTLPFALYVGASWGVSVWAAGILIELIRSLKRLHS